MTGILAYAQFTRYGRPAIVNGTPGIVTAWGGRPNAVMAFTVVSGRIAEIDIVADPERLTHVDTSEASTPEATVRQGVSFLRRAKRCVSAADWPPLAGQSLVVSSIASSHVGYAHV